MKMKAKGKLALAVAIMQHPAVQQAAREIGAAGLRKAQEWWNARKARKKKVIKKRTRKNEATSAKVTAPTAKRKKGHRGVPRKKRA